MEQESGCGSYLYKIYIQSCDIPIFVIILKLNENCVNIQETLESIIFMFFSVIAVFLLLSCEECVVQPSVTKKIEENLKTQTMAETNWINK